MKKIHVKATLIEEALGMSPASPDLYTKYIAGKKEQAKSGQDKTPLAKAALDEESAAIVAAQEENEIDETKGVTVFPRASADGKTPIFWDYQMKGFMKDACGALRKCTGYLSEGLKGYMKAIDGRIFVSPREIPILLPKNTQIGFCERALRANGPTGERMSLARSETVPVGSTVEFDVVCLADEYVDVVKEWFSYGEFRGFGQWRNSGKGRFTVEITDIKDARK